MNDGALIEEVRKYSFIYDPTDKRHHDQRLTKNAWEEVGDILSCSGTVVGEIIKDVVNFCLKNEDDTTCKDKPKPLLTPLDEDDEEEESVYGAKDDDDKEMPKPHAPVPPYDGKITDCAKHRDDWRVSMCASSLKQRPDNEAHLRSLAASGYLKGWFDWRRVYQHWVL
ncbi:unnamed protein product [Bemisia tabaci]|uniref:MADF domain-containing protein n=1 Tax=Bemisia tabaci TaxID=7038 RepID=A0A9P0FA49_BEMTA|nr:unnamed protein product [Bemisia tabaci]